jgi:NAD-dependent histone deacetylase SIR2
MKKIVEEERIPRCKICKGLVKPDIVFFGESVSVFIQAKEAEIASMTFTAQLPPNFYKALTQLEDADLLIVMGTSLTVQPFASLISRVTGKCPRVLINLDQVGDIGSGKNDLVLLGKCDDIIRDLARELGWEDELDKEWIETAKSLDNYETPTEKDKADEVKAELEHELEKITDRVSNALSITEKDGTVEPTEGRSGTGSGTSKDAEPRREMIPELPKISESQTGGEDSRQRSRARQTNW